MTATVFALDDLGLDRGMWRLRGAPVVTRRYDAAIVPVISWAGWRRDVEVDLDTAEHLFPNLRPAGISPRRAAIIAARKDTA